MHADVFLAVYTHECKGYCDEAFFNNILAAKQDAELHVVDNSLGLSYTERLKTLVGDQGIVEHLSVSRNDIRTLFQRNVAESANHLRKQFLDSNCKYFVIIESDVLPPTDFLDSFKEVLTRADILGGLYYTGFHPKVQWDTPAQIFQVEHVLSGCTLYKRELIEKIPFRWAPDCLGAFPDALISHDARQAGFMLANYSKIKCRHIEKDHSLVRGQENLC